MGKRALGILFIIVGFIYSSNAQMVSGSIEQFFYSKGYTDGKRKGYIEGYKKALEDVKKILKMYKIDIKALEAGKYADKHNLITPPRIYKVIKDGKIEEVVSGCSVEKERNIDDILKGKIPVIDYTEIQEAKNSKFRINQILNADKVKVMDTDKFNAPKVVMFDKNAKVKEALIRNNVPFSETDKYYKAYFFSNDDLKGFCNTTNLCKGE